MLRAPGFAALGLVVQLPLLADTRCSDCHESIVQSYARSAMGRSISRPRAEAQMQRNWVHDISGRLMGVQWQNNRLIHFMQDKGKQSAYEVSWAIGSGRHAKNYAVRISDSLFQSPIAWYNNRLIWDMAGGFQIDARPDFYRPITMDCLFCHAGKANPVPGTQNRYTEPDLIEPSIGCQRCHGDPAAHLSDAKRGNIVNPATLDRVRRDSVCESCHLPGEARVVNPGRKFTDFQPGMPLEAVFSIYVASKSADDTILRTNSHSEQMAASRCYTESKGTLWCGTCHAVHKEPSARQKWAYYRDRCQTCHKGEPAETHKSRYGDDCVRCHMRPLRNYEGQHGALTDHWIRTAKSEERFLDRGEYLRAWREPAEAFRNRNQAMAYLGNAAVTGSLKRYREGVRLVNEAIAEGHKDGSFATVVGMEFLRQKAAEKSLPWFAAAVQQEPANALRRLNFAAALASAGKTEEAKKEAEEAIRLEPLREETYALLAQIEPARANYWKEQYRKLAPKRMLP